MQLKSLLLLNLFLIFASPLFAVSPDIRLPEWYKSDFGILDWSPEEGILVVKAEIEARGVDLHQVSCALDQQLDPIDHKLPKKRELIKSGDKAVFMFRLHVKAPKNGWLNFDLRARPDKNDLQKRLDEFQDKPLTLEILKSEIEKMEQPVMLGQSLPIFLAEDIALSTMAVMAFRPYYFEKNCFYLWLPEERFGTGILAESMKALNKAAEAGQYRSAAAACNLVVNRLESSNTGLKASLAESETIEIPAQFAIEMLKINQAIFNYFEKSDESRLKEMVNSLKPGLNKAFACFNMAQIFRQQGQKQKARKWVEIALEIVPTWPEAKHLNEALK